MNPAVLLNKLKESKSLDVQASKFTLLVNEKSQEQGALFFIPVGSKEYKVVIPAPFHQDLLKEGHIATYQQVLNHKEAAILK